MLLHTTYMIPLTQFQSKHKHKLKHCLTNNPVDLPETKTTSSHWSSFSSIEPAQDRSFDPHRLTLTVKCQLNWQLPNPNCLISLKAWISFNFLAQSSSLILSINLVCYLGPRELRHIIFLLLSYSHHESRNPTSPTIIELVYLKQSSPSPRDHYPTADLYGLSTWPLRLSRSLFQRSNPSDWCYIPFGVHVLRLGRYHSIPFPYPPPIFKFVLLQLLICLYVYHIS